MVEHTSDVLILLFVRRYCDFNLGQTARPVTSLTLLNLRKFTIYKRQNDKYCFYK